MILICKKGVQSEQSSTAEEATEEEVDREEVATEEGGVEGEARPSRIKRRKLDDLIPEHDHSRGEHEDFPMGSPDPHNEELEIPSTKDTLFQDHNSTEQ